MTTLLSGDMIGRFMMTGNREGPRLRTVFSSDVRVGDVLQISDGQSIPADSILLSTCIPNGIGFIETSNLDVRPFRSCFTCQALNLDSRARPI